MIAIDTAAGTSVCLRANARCGGGLTVSDGAHDHDRREIHMRHRVFAAAAILGAALMVVHEGALAQAPAPNVLDRNGHVRALGGSGSSVT